MLETAPSLSIYAKDDIAVSGEEERENGLREDVKVMKSVEIGDKIEGSGDFSFAKPSMDLIKEEEKDELGEEINGVEEMEPPSSPPMHLASGFGIMYRFREERENDEEHYKELLDEFPNHPQVLKNYAKLLQRKGDLQGAEEYYFRAANVDPGDGEILSQYAILVWELHRDHERASTYFKLAAQAAPNDSNVLAAYAKFLWEVDDDEDDDQIEVAIGGFTGGKDSPIFEAGGLKNSAELEKYYRMMTEENPSDPVFLRNYAQFLYQSKGDLHGAEEYYSRFILANPQDGEMLLQYAMILWELYHDSKRTLSYMEQAVHAASEDSDILAAYARFLWSIDEDEL